MHSYRIKACLAQCPDRAVLLLGLLLTWAACLAQQSAKEDRQRAAIAAQVGPMTARLGAQLGQYEDLLRRLHEHGPAGTGDLPGTLPGDCCPGLLSLVSIAPDRARTPVAALGGLDDATRGQVCQRLSCTDAAPSSGVALQVLAASQPGQAAKGLLFLPVQAAQESRAGSAGAAAVFDFGALLQSLTSAAQVDAGIQLSPLTGSFGAPGPDPGPEESVQVNYAGPRGVVGNSTVVLGGQAWLVRWSVPASRGTRHGAAWLYAAGGIAASGLLFLGKRTFFPFVADPPTPPGDRALIGRQGARHATRGRRSPARAAWQIGPPAAAGWDSDSRDFFARSREGTR